MILLRTGSVEVVTALFIARSGATEGSAVSKEAKVRHFRFGLKICQNGIKIVKSWNYLISVFCTFWLG